jgi:Xaa-Pro dipeptidase
MPTLSPELCRVRQARLCARLADLNLDAAIITDPRHVFYLSGYWRIGRPIFISALLLRVDGRSLLVSALPIEDATAAEETAVFESNRIGTLIDDQPTALMKVLLPKCGGLKCVGRDEAGPLWHPAEWAITDLRPALWSMRRAKDADEVAVLRHAIAAAEAGYAWVRENVEPGMNEVAIYADIQAAAVRAAGEPIIELGNDFQSGALGGGPRDRAVEKGEAFILDVAVGVRGYASDLCRTFIIGAEPTAGQLEAHALVMQALAHVESRARAGVSCKALHSEVHAMIAGKNGWAFEHHTGHGIGLAAHEAPRLNPYFDDTLAVGDVFTVEPGLYGDDLRMGVRVEEDYVVRRDGGVEKLSSFPTGLLPTGK